MNNEEVAERYAAGEPVAAIAASHGCSRAHIYRRVNKQPFPVLMWVRARRRAAKRRARLRACEACATIYHPRAPSQRFCCPGCAAGGPR